MNFSVAQEDATAWLPDPWQDEWNGGGGAQRRSRASDKYQLFQLMALLPLTCLPFSYLFWDLPRAIASWGCHALQDIFFHLIFTRRIVNIFPTSVKLDTVLRLLERKGAFPKASRLLLQFWSSCRWLCRTPDSVPGNPIPWSISHSRQLLVGTVQLHKPSCQQGSPYILSKSHFQVLSRATTLKGNKTTSPGRTILH